MVRCKTEILKIWDPWSTFTLVRHTQKDNDGIKCIVLQFQVGITLFTVLKEEQFPTYFKVIHICGVKRIGK